VRSLNYNTAIHVNIRVQHNDRSSQMCGKNSDHFSSESDVGGRLRKSMRGRLNRIIREIIYVARSMRAINV